MAQDAGPPLAASGRPEGAGARSAKVQVYAAAANAAFADKAAGAIAAAGHDIVTGDFAASGADAVLVVWSGSAIGSRRLIEAARAPLACGRLVAVAIGRIEPPDGFREPAPVDLTNWTGDPDDPRWRSVIAEIERIAGRTPEPQDLDGFNRWFEPPFTDAEGPAHRRPAIAASLPLARRPSRSAALLLGGFGLAAAAILAGFVLLARRSDEAPPTLAVVTAPEISVAPQTEAPAPDATAPDATTRAEPAQPPANATPSETAPAPLVADGAAQDGIAALIVAHSGEPAAAPSLEVPPADEISPGAAMPGWIRDCPACPELAVIPAGSYRMGAEGAEAARRPEEGPPLEVRIARPFALARRETSVAEWRACVAAKACPSLPDPGWRSDDMPIVNASHADALAYVRWLSETTGKRYRLPSEAEWEYAARAGADTPFAFGAVLSAREASFDGSMPYRGAPGPQRSRPRPVGSYAPNAFGLHDMHGNVWEWTADCWSPNHRGAAADGSARGGQCSQRTMKGGAWNSGGWRLRASHRIGKAAGAREYDNGFRVARDLP